MNAPIPTAGAAEAALAKLHADKGIAGVLAALDFGRGNLPSRTALGLCANDGCNRVRKHGSKFCQICSANWRQLAR